MATQGGSFDRGRGLEAQILFAEDQQDYQNLYTELMEASPYVETQLLLDVINIEDYPELALRNIMVANPHASREGEVWEALVNREPMLSQQTLDDIQDEQKTITTHYVLNMQISQAQHASEYATVNLLQVYANDASTNQISAIRNHLKNRDEPIFRYMLIDSYLASGDIAQAQNELALIDSECEMSEDSEQELTGMTTWYGIVDDNLENLHDLSSADITALTTLAQDPNDYRPSGLARTLLKLNDAPVDYTEPVYFPGQVNNKRANQVAERPESVQTKFSLSPNPAGDKIRLSWSSEELYPVKEMEVQITDMQGKVVLQQQLSDVSLEMTLFNLNGFINGTYILEVRHEENTLYSEKFIVKK